MTLFVVGAACLIVIAIGMLRPAWWPARVQAAGRPAHLGILGEQLAALDRELASGQLDADQHRLARNELQRRVLDESATPEPGMRATGSRKTVIGIGLAVPILAVALYAAIGNPAALTPPTTAAAADAEVTPEALNTMLATLAQRLEKSSGNAATDLQGWTMLARSYAALQRFDDADKAFVRALALAPRDAPLLADRADVLAMLQGQRTAGEPERLALEALRIDPKNVKALALVGAAAFERKDWAAARGYWQQARALTPDGSEFAAGLDRSIAELGGSSGGNPAVVAPAAAGQASDRPTLAAAPAATAGSVARLSGHVSLSPAFASKVAPTDTVFVFARAAEGPRMPLAIVRRTVADLPFDFTLDDSMAMSPQMKLSAFDRVVVGVRVSRSGNAMPQAGDLHGESPPTGTKVDGLQLVIDGVLP